MNTIDLPIMSDTILQRIMLDSKIWDYFIVQAHYLSWNFAIVFAMLILYCCQICDRL